MNRRSVPSVILLVLLLAACEGSPARQWCYWGLNQGACEAGEQRRKQYIQDTAKREAELVECKVATGMPVEQAKAEMEGLTGIHGHGVAVARALYQCSEARRGAEVGRP